MEIEVENYKKFDVYKLEDNYSFFHIKIKEENFIEELVQEILNEENLIKYIQNQKNIEIDHDDVETIENMYDMLYTFLDSENDEMDISTFEEKIKSIIQEESESIREEDTKTFVRLSKIGRFGEFIMSTILTDYFQFDCIIPKIKLSTDRNMSVYGIDTIYMNTNTKLLLFGESKISKTLNSAIALINESLKGYENNIEDEYMLVLKNNHLKKLEEFEVYYQEQKKNGICINFKDFIKTSKTSKIGIPIFIAHGENMESNTVLKKLKNSIKRKKFFDLETKYYIISLPIIDKSRFTLTFTKVVKEKKENYESIIRSSNNTRM